MRGLIQRTSGARVEIAGRTVAQIGRGIVVLVCAMRPDTEKNADLLAKKTAFLRIFPDADGKMNRALTDIGGSALVVSQFTLGADTSRGNRPGFCSAAPHDVGKTLYERFCAELRSYDVDVATGEFGADMQVSLTNDGPVTIWLEA